MVDVCLLCGGFQIEGCAAVLSVCFSCFGKAPAYALAAFQSVRINNAGLLTCFVQSLSIYHQFNNLPGRCSTSKGRC